MTQVFAKPQWLGLGLVVLVGAVAILRGEHRRRLDWRALAQPGEPPVTGAWSWWVALGFLTLALGEPRWGREPGFNPPAGHDVVLVVDVSRSMGAEDAFPDRLGLARRAARSLVDQFRREPGDRAAVVAFAGRAVARCPLTEDLDAVLDSLEALRPGGVEPGGTDLGAGLSTALELFDDQEHAGGRAIVVFSDGEDHVNAWRVVVERLVSASVVVHAVAIGDPENNHPVPAAKSPHLPSEPPIMTRRTDAALTQLAHATGGATVPLGIAASDLGALYRDQIEPTTRVERHEPRFDERAERFAIPLVAALGAAVLGTWPSPRWSPARRRIARNWGRILVLVVITLVLVLASLAATPAPSAPRGSAARANIEGLHAYRDGRFLEALTGFERSISHEPTNPVGPFNAGAALFALGRYSEAAARYVQCRDRVVDPTWIVKAEYALGNCSALMGDFEGAIGHYDASLAVPGAGADLAPVQRDAAINREFARAQLPPEARPPTADQGEGSGKNRRPDSPPKDPQSPDSAPDNGSSDPGGPGNPSGTASGRRGSGGAGGNGAAPPEADSPQNRLDAALRRIRAAKARQAVKPPPSPSPTGAASGKDW